MERIPRLVAGGTSPVTPSSLKRFVGSPSGLTPDKKRYRVQENTKRRWTPRSKSCIVEVISDFTDDGTTPNNDANYWKRVSLSLERSGILRTADACRKFCTRKQLLPDTNAVDDDLGVTPMKCTIATQTDISLPPSSSIPSDPNAQEVGIIPVKENLAKASETARMIHRTALLRLQSAPGIMMHEERFPILSAALTETPSTIASAVWNCSSVKTALVQLMVKDIEEEAIKLSLHPSKHRPNAPSSCLFKSDFSTLSTFKWQNIGKELVEHQSLLCQVLLAVALPSSSIGNDSATEKVSKRICATYAMLMQARNKDMSLFQRLMTSLLESEHSSQRVKKT